MLCRFLTPWRLRWYPRAAITALLLAFLVVLLTSSGSKVLVSYSTPQFGRLGGDFTEFYGAGKIVLSGRFDKLYDQDEQRLAQKDIVLEKETFVPFAYPPQMALLYSLFSRMPFRAAYYVHTFLMFAALAVSLLLLQGRELYRSGYYGAVFAAILFYYPLLKALLGGQNTPLTIFLLAASYAAMRADRDLLAGMCLGLLLYKPQLSLVMLCLFLLAGKWRVFAVGAGMGLFFYLLGWYYCGQEWVMRWFLYAEWVVTTSMFMEGDKAISWIGFLRNALGVKTPAVLAAGYVMAGLTAVMLAVIWAIRYGKVSLRNLYGLAVPGLILISPHTYYYDAGILALSAFAIYCHGCRYRIQLLALIWLLGMLQFFSVELGFSPVFFSVLVSFAVMAFAVMGPGGTIRGHP